MIERFRVHLESTETPRTVLAYMPDVLCFEEFRSGRDRTIDVYEEWVGSLSVRAQTVKRKCAGVNRWLAFLARHGDDHAARTLAILQGGYQVGREVRQADVTIVGAVTEGEYLAAAAKAPEWGRAIMGLLWFTGARISEVVGDTVSGIPALTVTNGVELITRGYTITQGKGGKRRVIVLPSAARPLLRVWVAHLIIQASRNMAPSATSDNAPNGRGAHAKASAQMTPSPSFGAERPNHPDVSWSQLGIPVSRPDGSASDVSALGDLVSHIVLGRPEKEMARVDASGVVAPMANKESAGDMSKCEFPRDTMGAILAPSTAIRKAVVDNTVSQRDFSPTPLPTGVALPYGDASPKSGTERAIWTRHVQSLAYGLGESPLFPSPRSPAKSVTARAVDAMLKRTGGRHAHAYRHSLKERLRLAGVDKEVRMALMGHGPEDAHQRYGPARIEEMLRAAERLT